MPYRSIVLATLIGFAVSVVAQPQPVLYFPALTQAMGLKMPKLNKNDCEVRVWQKCQLCFGEAHVLYQVIKTGEEISFFKYVMYFNRYNFIKATKTKLRSTSTNELWQRLVQQGILTLPDESVIADELHTRQQRDSTWSTVDADGTVSVHAKKIKPSVWISDGESYHFEIFSTDSYRAYNYSNPDGYVKRRPDIAELQKVVSILDELKGALRKIPKL